MTTSPAVPNEAAVEAAARAIYETQVAGREWDAVVEVHQRIYRKVIAPAALAAAMPVLRQQWEDEEIGLAVRITRSADDRIIAVDEQGRELRPEPVLRAQIADELTVLADEATANADDLKSAGVVQGLRIAAVRVARGGSDG